MIPPTHGQRPVGTKSGSRRATTLMRDNFYRDYRVERAEDMLSQGANITAYPRLSLAAGQRFASMGAYIARFTRSGERVAESDWIVL